MPEQQLDAENAPAQERNLDEARDAAILALFTSDERREPSPLQRVDLNALNDTAIEFGTQILLVTPPGRERALAMTHLEDSLIRARRAIFGTIL